MFRSGTILVVAASLALIPQPELRAQDNCANCLPTACSGNSGDNGNNGNNGNNGGQGNAYGNGGNTGNGNGKGNNGNHGTGNNGNGGGNIGTGPQNCDPIDLIVETDIDFGRLVLVGDGVGRVVIDLASGGKTTFGGLDDLGGIAVKGRAVITGTANQIIRVDIPNAIVMSDPAGGEAELRDFVSDLPALPVLDQNGQLAFHFTGTMYTDANTAVGGKLRGRIPISVQYN